MTEARRDPVAAAVNRVEAAERLRDLLEEMLATLETWRPAVRAELAAESAAGDPSKAKLFLLEYYLKWIDGLAGDLEGPILDQIIELFNVTRTTYHEAVLARRAGKP